jgi:pimeloyl-ACP methyl ester carboxylesterase
MAYFGWLCLVPLVLLLVIWLALTIWPVPTSRLVSRPNPAANYAEALKRLLALANEEATLPLHALCATRLLDHGRRTGRVVVLLHGYTNCPEQLGRLAERLYEQGDNVLIPRMPYHGQADRGLASQSGSAFRAGTSNTGESGSNPAGYFSTDYYPAPEPSGDALGCLTAEALSAWAEQALDIACGLGEQVVIFGFSTGGACTLWLAQNRPEVDLAVTLSAFLGIGFIPSWLHRAFIRLFLILPSLSLWWDPARKQASPYSVEYSYPLFSLRDLSQTLRLSSVTDRLARSTPPSARRIIFLVNESDPGVSNRRLLDLAACWKRYPNTDVCVERFRATDKPMHDVITPGLPGVSTDIAYQQILAALEK